MRHLRLLFWLRWKYMWRAAWSRRATMVVGWMMSILIALVAAFFIYVLLSKAREDEVPSDVFSEYLALGFAFLYLGWIYFSSLSDLFDPQKLAGYPIPPRTIFIGSCLSTVMGQMPVYAGAIWVALALGWPAPAWPVTMMRALLFVVMIAQLVMVSRLLRLTFLQFLTSRRWRDIAMIMGAIIGTSFYLLWNLVRSNSAAVQDVLQRVSGAAERHAISTWLCWMPSTWFAKSFEGDGMVPALATIGAIVSTVVISWLGGKAEETLAFSEPVFSYTPKKRKLEGGPPRFLRGLTGTIGRLFGGEIAAVARKEAVLLARDPVVRSRLIIIAFYYVIMLFLPAITGRGGVKMPGSMSGFVILFIEMQLLLNIFGTDGVALKAMAAMPVKRLKVVLGKNLCYGLFFLPVNLVLIATYNAFHAPEELRVLPVELAVHASSFLALLGAGSLFSVFLPVRVITPGQRIQRTESDETWLTGWARMGALMGLGVLMAPIGVLRWLMPQLPVGWVGHAAVIAGALVYGVALYAAGAWLAGKALAAREERLIGRFASA